MQKSIAKESRHRRLARRLGVAVIALAAVLTLGACRATGGGYIDEPRVGVGNVFQGEANFGFNFTCEVETENKRAVIRGSVTYHDDPSTLFPDGIRLHGTVDPFFIDLANLTELPPDEPDIDCADAGVRSGLADLGKARFRGEYRSQDTTIPAEDRTGRFEVEVQDLGEPEPSLEGDSFDILLTGGEYGGYNRFGFVEGGNIQVEED